MRSSTIESVSAWGSNQLRSRPTRNSLLCSGLYLGLVRPGQDCQTVRAHVKGTVMFRLGVQTHQTLLEGYAFVVLHFPCYVVAWRCCGLCSERKWVTLWREIKLEI